MSSTTGQTGGRVICAWCKRDMGPAQTELDTHGCCLGCLRLALREMDERLSAFAQGQEAKGQPGRGDPEARRQEALPGRNGRQGQRERRVAANQRRTEAV